MRIRGHITFDGLFERNKMYQCGGGGPPLVASSLGEATVCHPRVSKKIKPPPPPPLCCAQSY